MNHIAAKKLVIFGVPGSGITQLVEELGALSAPGKIWETNIGIAQVSGLDEYQVAISCPDKLVAFEDESVRELDPASYEIFCFTGSELTRAANQEIVSKWDAEFIELSCDLKTQTSRLGFNVAHQVGLGPVRAQLRQQTEERRKLWKSLNAARIDTSGWGREQFEVLAARMLEGK